ncbi:PREDICTED: glutathione S-transferase 2-like [Papilio polytes]|uniref:glutathione S-transferase 2-like n=1 Tax=Papilio polytes TaxID=76194 RepID=UPI000675CFF2|nr:PREDICTED: glutathione S-transferase 2-like [Papilio polytes]
MPKVTVTYFNTKGLGEGIRMLLAYGGQEFEDVRLEKEQWAELKPKTPFGQLPMVKIDGKQYAQSVAICRYLGRKYGLSGSDIEEDLIIDQNLDFFNDVRSKAASAHYEPDEKLKAIKLGELKKEQLPLLFGKLDEIIQKNNGYLAAGKLTWADFIFAGIYDAIKMVTQMPELDEKYPSFKKLKDTVCELPKVKAYIDAAPKTDY